MKAAPNENVILDNGMTIRTHDLVFEGGGTVGVNEPDRISVFGTNGGESAIDFGRGNNSPNVKGNVIEDVHTRNVYYDDDSTNDTVRYSEVGPSDFGGNGNLCADLFVTGHTFNPVIEYNLIHDNKGTGSTAPTSTPRSQRRQRHHPGQPDLVVRHAVHLRRRPGIDADREQHDRRDQCLRRRLRCTAGARSHG